MRVSFVLSFFPRDVLDEILDLIESVSDGFPTYSFRMLFFLLINVKMPTVVGILTLMSRKNFMLS